MNFNDIFTKTFREGFAGAELGFLEMMLVYALADIFFSFTGL